MARMKPIIASKSAGKVREPEAKWRSSAERSAYFARREAAKVLRSALQGDARRRAVGSIKTLVYSPSVRNKKATFALVCETLKHLSIIKEVMEEADVVNAKWKKQKELLYIITYDLLFGKEDSLTGDAEKHLMLKKKAFESALSRVLKRKGLKNVKDLMALDKTSELQKPRYVRVNTLKTDTTSAIHELRKQYAIQEDDTVPDLLVLPPGADLHKHPLVLNGSVFLQGKASSMPAVALDPKPEWEVIDACSAPGNKTVHLAALMNGKGKIIACELNKERVERLINTVKLAAATNVEVKHEDFLNLDPTDPSYSKVRAILLDPSCSGSGTAIDRLDHLLPSHSAGQSDHVDEKRLQRLASFQKRVLEHALSFPAVERIVYSTCSVHQIENEDVINSVLHLASSRGFQLASAFPQWPRRGLPTFDGSEHLLRTDLTEDKEGFFIALFVRKPQLEDGQKQCIKKQRTGKLLNFFVARMLKMQPYTRFKLSRSKTNPPLPQGTVDKPHLSVHEFEQIEAAYAVEDRSWKKVIRGRIVSAMGRFRFSENKEKNKEKIKAAARSAKDKEQSSKKRGGGSTSLPDSPNRAKKAKASVDDSAKRSVPSSTIVEAPVDKGKGIVGATDAVRSSSSPIRLPTFFEEIKKSFSRSLPARSGEGSPDLEQKLHLTFDKTTAVLYAQYEMLNDLEDVRGPMKEKLLQLSYQLSEVESELEVVSRMSKRKDDTIAKLEKSKCDADTVIDALRVELEEVEKGKNGEIEDLRSRIESLSDENRSLRRGEGLDFEALVDLPSFDPIKECIEDTAGDELVQRIKEVHPEWDLGFLTNESGTPSVDEQVHGGVDPSTGDGARTSPNPTKEGGLA